MARFPDFPGSFETCTNSSTKPASPGCLAKPSRESRSDWIRFALVTSRVDEAAQRLANYFG